MADVSLVLITPSTVEPVSRTEAKLWLKIDASSTEDDPLVDSLIITAARRQIYRESTTSRLGPTYTRAKSDGFIPRRRPAAHRPVQGLDTRRKQVSEPIAVTTKF